MDHSYSAQLEQKVQYQAADLALQADEIEWSAHYRALLESKLEEAGLSPPKLQIGLVEVGLKTTRKQQTKTSKDKGYEPSFFTSAIAQSQNEARNVKDMLAKMEKRALAAEERAAEAVVAERKARAALDAREKQLASMRLRFDKLSENIEASEAHRKELQEYVEKLERKLRGRSIGYFRRGTVSSYNSYQPNEVRKESLYEMLAELQSENAKLHSALQEVEEALDGEAKKLSLADGGALLESLRTRRLLETAELALKKETSARKQTETMLQQAEKRAMRAEDERADRVKAEDTLLARCEVAERDNQALLDYIQELTSQTAPSPAKRLSSQSEVNELKAMNEQLTKSCREAREKAAQLQWQLEQGSSPQEADDTGRTAVLESIIDSLVSILSKTLGVDSVSKGYQHVSVDAMIFATQRLVTKLHTELRESVANSGELQEARESLRHLTTELRLYKKKCERLESRTDELEDEIERSSPPARPSSTKPAVPKRQPYHLASEGEIDSKTVFASRIDRIAALKKRLGLASSPQFGGGIGYMSDSSEEGYKETGK